MWVASDTCHGDSFHLGSGATLHITHQKYILHDFIVAVSGSVMGLNTAILFVITGKGTLYFLLLVGSSLTRIFPLLVVTLFRFPKRLPMMWALSFSP